MEDGGADGGDCLPAGGRRRRSYDHRHRPVVDLDRRHPDAGYRLRLSPHRDTPHGGRLPAVNSTGQRGMKVKYFAWMKRTVGVLVAWLRNRSGGHAEALAPGAAFGAAVDRRTAPFDAKLAGASEVAF